MVLGVSIIFCILKRILVLGSLRPVLLERVSDRAVIGSSLTLIVIVTVKAPILADIGKYWAISGDIRVFWADIWGIRVICSSDRSVTCWARSDSSRSGSVKYQARSVQHVSGACHYNKAENGRVNTIRLTLCVLSPISGLWLWLLALVTGDMCQVKGDTQHVAHDT